MGGCGTQLGMIFTFVGLAAILMFCSICAISNVVSVAIAQEVARLSAEATAEARMAVVVSSDPEAEALRSEIEALVMQVESLQANEPIRPAEPPAEPEPAMPVATPTPLPSLRPLVIAHQSGVDLHSGPGRNYNLLGYLPLGGYLEVVGRNADSSWWLVSAPDGLAWASADSVLALNTDGSLPVVSVPALLVLPATGQAQLAPGSTPQPVVWTTPTPTPILGTPTATAVESRLSVEDTVGYKVLEYHMSAAPVSTSFSPNGGRIAMTEGVKLYLVAADASYSRVLFGDDGIRTPVGDAVWSPDGDYIAFTAKHNSPDCKPCRSVGIVRMSDEAVYFLQTPDNMDSAAPRWTQDGRLLVNVYPGEPADGITYVYNTSGQGGVAEGVFVLSSSHEGQKWLPWVPGRIWQAGVTERPDAYWSD
jgi:hypothetical protein